MGDRPEARPLTAHRTKEKHNKRRMKKRMGFEPTISGFSGRNSSSLKSAGHCDRLCSIQRTEIAVEK
jgi:hypothetical protein